MNHLRSLGPFTRNWWRLDEFPPIYGIPDFCDVKHGFVVNRQSASKILKARADSKYIGGNTLDCIIWSLVDTH